jgi:hypothetical protein
MTYRALDSGAEVHNPGRHASLVGAGADAVNTDMDSVTAASLHSYPLMWAVAAALRSDSTVKVGLPDMMFCSPRCRLTQGTRVQSTCRCRSGQQLPVELLATS